MNQYEDKEIKGDDDWRSILDGDLTSADKYYAAVQKLQDAEQKRAFDAKARAASSAREKRAADLIRKIQILDRQNVYGGPTEFDGAPEEKRSQGGHFLGNVDLINRTDLMKVSKRMPKGSHLHIHFNACLPAHFLIRQARHVVAMYIRSTMPLTTASNFATSQISFMVMRSEEASQNDRGQSVGLGNCFDAGYTPNRWMPYQLFQRDFWFVDEYGVSLAGTEGAEEWLARKMLISEKEAHGYKQTGHGIWEQFNYRTQMMKGLFIYESAFKAYTRACIEDFVEDNIQYAEIRPNFMSSNSLRMDDGTPIENANEAIMRFVDEELKATMASLASRGKYFGGLKVIYCTPRSFQTEQVAAALDECITLKLKYPNLVCGFDLVGHEEMGNELRHFIPQFIDFQQKCKAKNLEIPFLFHCGETLEVGDKVDGNLFDAVLLKAKRIGHGYAIARHPMIMDIFKEKNIAIESCPISNEILGLTPNIAGHNLPILLANNVPCTINSDNATFYRSSLSHDFYQVMIGSESMSLLGWKQLAKWSLEHSCMNPTELASVTREWEDKWDEFCTWIVEKYEYLEDAKYACLENPKPRKRHHRAILT